MWFQKMKKRKIQSILIVLIVMVCSMLMTSAVTIMTSWEQPYTLLQAECNSPKTKIYLQVDELSLAQSIQKRFDQLPEVSNTEIIEYAYITGSITVRGEEISGFIDLSPYNEYQHKTNRMIAGSMEHLGPQECVIPAVLANQKNIKIGEEILIENDISYKVKGIYADPYNMSISFDTEIIVGEVPKNMSLEYYISVFSEKIASGNDLVDLYREANDGILEGRNIAVEDRISNNQMTEQILGGILLAMSVLILMVGGIMIRYMIKNLLLTDRTSIAIYKTIGYQNSHITGIYMKLYLVLVIIGSALGSVFSRSISNAFTKITFKNLGITTNNGIWEAGLVCSGIILIYVMIQVFFVIRKTKNIRPMEVFRQEIKIPMSKKSKARENMSFSPLSMAIRMILRERKNTAVIVLTCIMAIYCVNFGGTALVMMSEMSNMNYYWIGFDKHQISLEATKKDEFAEKLLEIEQLPETDKIIRSSTDLAVSLPWEKGMGDAVMASMTYETYEDIEMSCLEGRNPKYSNEIAIGNAIAIKMDKNVGDYLTIYLQGDKKVTLLICGTFQSFYDIGNSCRLLGDTWEEQGIAVNYYEAGLYLKEGISEESFFEKYENQFSDSLEMFPREEKYASIMNMITGPQMLALRPFIAMTLILGGLNIIAVIYLKNKDYSIIFSIYKALGYSANHLMKTNIIYVGLIALGSITITVPLFIVFFPKLMAFSMSFVGFKEYPVVYDPMILLISNLLAFVVFMICGMVSSKSLYGNPIEDLTCE